MVSSGSSFKYGRSCLGVKARQAALAAENGAKDKRSQTVFQVEQGKIRRVLRD